MLRRHGVSGNAFSVCALLFVAAFGCGGRGDTCLSSAAEGQWVSTRACDLCTQKRIRMQRSAEYCHTSLASLPVRSSFYLESERSILRLKGGRKPTHTGVDKKGRHVGPATMRGRAPPGLGDVGDQDLEEYLGTNGKSEDTQVPPSGSNSESGDAREDKYKKGRTRAPEIKGQKITRVRKQRVDKEGENGWVWGDSRSEEDGSGDERSVESDEEWIRELNKEEEAGAGVTGDTKGLEKGGVKESGVCEIHPPVRFEEEPRAPPPKGWVDKWPSSKQLRAAATVRAEQDQARTDSWRAAEVEYNRDPDNFESIVKHAQALFDKGTIQSNASASTSFRSMMLNEAASLLTSAVQMKPHDLNVLSLSAKLQQYLGRAAEARRLYEQALLVSPAHGRALLGLSEMSGDIAYETRLVQRCINSTNDTQALLYARLKLASIHARQGHQDQALQLFAEAAHMHPNSLAVRSFACARALKFEGRNDTEFDQTERLWLRALELDPGDAHILASTAGFLQIVRPEQWHAAERLYRAALEAQPTLPFALGGYAELLWERKGDVQGAEKAYRDAIKYSATLRGDLYSTESAYVSGRNHAVHTSRAFEGAQKPPYSGGPGTSANTRKEALQDGSGSTSGGYHDAYARFLAQLDRCDEAHKNFRRAFDLGVTSVHAIEAYAGNLLTMNDTQGARQVLEKELQKKDKDLGLKERAQLLTAHSILVSQIAPEEQRRAVLDHQEATLRQALALDPTSQNTALYLAGVLADKGLVQETAQMLARACKGGPEEWVLPRIKEVMQIAEHNRDVLISLDESGSGDSEV